MSLIPETAQSAVLNVLVSFTGKPKNELEAMLSGETPEEIEGLATSRLRTLRDEGDKAGRGKLQKALNKLAKERFGVDGEFDTVESTVEAIKEGYKPALDPASLTEETVKSHPAFKAVETKLFESETTYKKALEDKEKQLRGELQHEQLKAKAIAALGQFGAVLTEDAKVEEFRTKQYLESLKGIEAKAIEGGKTEFYRDGKRLEDPKTLLPLTEGDLLKGAVEQHYTVKVSDQRTAPGAKPPGNPAGPQTVEMAHYKGILPKTQDEYEAIAMDYRSHSADARIEVADYWDKQQEKPA